MSWLSVIKNNIVNAITNHAPPEQQAPVHQAATAAADAIGGLLNVFENVAEGVITTAVAQHLGPAAAALEYDFLHALITKAQARQTAITLPTPALITPPAQPAAAETQT